jgi:hypothetical protein
LLIRCLRLPLRRDAGSALGDFFSRDPRAAMPLTQMPIPKKGRLRFQKRPQATLSCTDSINQISALREFTPLNT